MKTVLVIGSGAREHALAWKISQSKVLKSLYVAPGNAGTAQVATNINIQADDIVALANFAKLNAVDLTVVGPDSSLAKGIVDYFQKRNLRIFGPTKKAAEIEWSKVYAKRIMKKYDIPTAKYAAFSQLSKALSYVQAANLPIVIKADGLALGKGVFICKTLEEAKRALIKLMQGKAFGLSGKKVVIEEFLVGTEVSVHAICDGDNFLLFPLAQDHKRLGEGNTGPNTGGMGTICPVPESLKGIKEIVSQTLSALKAEGREFVGCLFPGVILTSDGPKVLEFNARFGDPETQVYMRLLKNDLLEVLLAATEKRLSDCNLNWKDAAAASIVLASGGYPEKYNKGLEINGLENVLEREAAIFYAGVECTNGKYYTNGGRVVNVTAIGRDLKDAIAKAYKSVEKISFKDKFFRKDIGQQYLLLG